MGSDRGNAMNMRWIAPVGMLAVALSAGCGGHTSIVQTEADCVVRFYFSTSTPKNEIRAIVKAAKNDPRVAALTFTSAEKALAKLKKKYPELAGSLSSNPLPASLLIRPHRAADSARIVTSLHRHGLSASSDVQDRCQPALAKPTRVDTTPLARGPEQLSTAERKRFELRLQRDLAAGRARKHAQITANRATLNALPLIAGARLEREAQNPESKDRSWSIAEQEYGLYALEKLQGQDFFAWDSSGWGTFRIYSVPAAVTATDVRTFVIDQLSKRWLPAGETRSSRADGNPMFDIWFASGKRCVWYMIGSNTGVKVAGRRTLEVATDLGRGSIC